jgi:hypothetical protein
MKSGSVGFDLEHANTCCVVRSTLAYGKKLAVFLLTYNIVDIVNIQ